MNQQEVYGLKREAGDWTDDTGSQMWLQQEEDGPLYLALLGYMADNTWTFALTPEIAREIAEALQEWADGQN